MENATSRAAIPGNSASSIVVKNYFFVGPAASGCFTPPTTRSVTAWYNWSYNYSTVSAAAHCASATGGFVNATVKLYIAANIHFATAPFYVAPQPSPSYIVLSHTLSLFCNVAGKNGIYGPAPASGWANLTLSSLNLTGGVSYDYYSGLWEELTVTDFAGTTGDWGTAAATLAGTFHYMNCSC